jgi:hypothetical protein
MDWPSGEGKDTTASRRCVCAGMPRGCVSFPENKAPRGEFRDASACAVLVACEVGSAPGRTRSRGTQRRAVWLLQAAFSAACSSASAGLLKASSP